MKFTFLAEEGYSSNRNVLIFFFFSKPVSTLLKWFLTIPGYTTPENYNVIGCACITHFLLIYLAYFPKQQREKTQSYGFDDNMSMPW